MAENSDYILELLTEYGMVTPEQVDEGWQKVSDSDGRLDIIEALQELKYVERDELMAMLAQQYGLETLDLTGYEIPDEIIQTMTPEIVRQYNAIPVMVHDDVLTVAMSDPTAMDALDGLRYVLNRDVEAVISPQEQIQKVMDHYYGTLTDSVNTLLNGMETGNLEQVEDADSGNEASGDDAPIIRLVYLLITEAYKMKASDIHLEPLEDRKSVV